MRYAPQKPTDYLSIGEVCAKTTLGKSCIYDLIRDGEFPRPRQLTRGRVGWVQSEIDEWNESRPVVDADVAA